jgi:membrane protein YdbS with pleckstrin-like domain
MNGSWWIDVLLPTLVVWLFSLGAITVALDHYDGPGWVAVVSIIVSLLVIVTYQTWRWKSHR